MHIKTLAPVANIQITKSKKCIISGSMDRFQTLKEKKYSNYG